MIPSELEEVAFRTNTLGPDIKKVGKTFDSLRNLQSKEGIVEADLALFMEFKLIRGSIDSAPIEDFEFFVFVEAFTPWELTLRFEFSSPLSISIGKNPDILRTTVINPKLFISKNSGKTMAGGSASTINTVMPRQYPNEAEFILIETTAETLEVSY